MSRLLATLIAAGWTLVNAGRLVAAPPDADTAALVESLPRPAPTANESAPRPVHSLAATRINDALRDSVEALATTNLWSRPANPTTRQDKAREAGEWREKLEIARRQRLHRLRAEATATLIAVILANTPDEMKRTALLELAIIAQEEGALARAQQIFAHYLAKWPDDPGVPEVMLRQGLILRQMGLNNLALTKFYAVMTTSLLLKADQLEYYQRLVLQAQTEIAETYFLQGKFADSAELFARVLKLESPLLNTPLIHFKLVRSLAALGKFEDVTVQCLGFLERHTGSAEEPEVRFHLATALQQAGRHGDALQQVMLLLHGQQSRAQAQPEVWARWQQRTGNEIGNQLYKEGDYLRALEVYSALAGLNTNAGWQFPVQYQIGLTYERLQQPVQALREYTQIVRREPELTTNAAPNLRMVLEMARWRQQSLAWHTNAEAMTRDFRPTRPALPQIQPKDTP